VTALIRPMLAVAGTLPPAWEDDAYAYEMKWDGVRAVVYVDRDGTRVMSRNDRDVTGSYPEVAALAPTTGARTYVLDGEIVAFDDRGRPSFGVLQQRMHVTSAAQVHELRRRVPVMFLAFDVLRLDGRDTMGLAYDQRRQLLEGLGDLGGCAQAPPAFSGDGAAARATSTAQRLEGVIAKRRSSAYEPGRRSRAWLKVKHVRTQEVVVAGWKPGQGRRAGGIGSLLLGVPGADGQLEYAGHVGTGFTAGMLTDLQRQLSGLVRRTSPFAQTVPRADARDARWVEPRLVGEVAFTEWTRDGRLRHPSWRGLRPDKGLGDVRRES
jgi:bifunctional non-homologous end joining protein LigD